MTRAIKHFNRPPVGMWGSFTFATTYSWPPERRPYAEDKVLLDAYNASMFAEFRDVDRGTLEAFLLDYDKEFNEAWLRDQGMPPDLIKTVLKLGNLYKTRVLAHPNKDKRCTLYSTEQRGRVPAGCGYCFGTSPKPSERGQPAGHHHSKPIFKTSSISLGLYLRTLSLSTPRSSTGILF